MGCHASKPLTLETEQSGPQEKVFKGIVVAEIHASTIVNDNIDALQCSNLAGSNEEALLLKRHIAELAETRAQVTSEFKTQLAELQQENKELKQRVSELQSMVETRHQAELDALQAEKSQLKAEMTSLARRYDTLKSDFAKTAASRLKDKKDHSSLLEGQTVSAKGLESTHCFTSTPNANEAFAKAVVRDNPECTLQLTWQGHDCSKWEGAKLSSHKAILGLTLKRAKLRCMPGEIAALSSLETLILSNNNLETLPSGIGRLEQLQVMLLDNNNIEVLPPEIGFLTNLQTLWLNNNKLKTLPGTIGCMSSLQRLLLSDNEIEELPTTIGDLRNLDSLWLDNNQLKALPVELASLKSLSRIRLDGNQMTHIPQPLQRLCRLRASTKDRLGSSASNSSLSPKSAASGASARASLRAKAELRFT